jgi:hypothetical protein
MRKLAAATNHQQVAKPATQEAPVAVINQRQRVAEPATQETPAAINHLTVAVKKVTLQITAGKTR